MDHEARAHADQHAALRLWLRLLSATQLIEQRVRSRLRSHWNTTLPRFDLMAQLERAPDGLKMSELAGRMMVTGGNITAIVDQLEREALVSRNPVTGDRRAWLISLTAKGREVFLAMAGEHERWIIEAFAALDEHELAELHALLGKVKAHVRALSEDTLPRKVA
ncbi:MAG: MarR family winged helix-turn-helix transcriptional regulator [Casimicrobiaceae bacterium]